MKFCSQFLWAVNFIIRVMQSMQLFTQNYSLARPVCLASPYPHLRKCLFLALFSMCWVLQHQCPFNWTCYTHLQILSNWGVNTFHFFPNISHQPTCPYSHMSPNICQLACSYSQVSPNKSQLTFSILKTVRPSHLFWCGRSIAPAQLHRTPNVLPILSWWNALNAEISLHPRGLVAVPALQPY